MEVTAWVKRPSLPTSTKRRYRSTQNPRLNGKVCCPVWHGFISVPLTMLCWFTHRNRMPRSSAHGMTGTMNESGAGWIRELRALPSLIWAIRLPAWNIFMTSWTLMGQSRVFGTLCAIIGSWKSSTAPAWCYGSMKNTLRRPPALKPACINW